MTGDKWGRILDRLAGIEREIAALYRELDEIDEVIDEAELDEAERARLRARLRVGYACDVDAALSGP